jgi:hypothetical protein
MKENSREEDIKILENYIYNKKETMKEQLVKAIEHLIKAYKELEEKVMQKDLEIIGVEEYTKASIGEIIEHYYTANEDCISKSLVEEKIEELKEEIRKENVDFDWNKNSIIAVLQELLEKR